LLPTGNLQGSVKFCALETGGYITRDHCTPLPMPDDVLVKLNKMAQAQKPIGKTAKFGRGMAGAVSALTGEQDSTSHSVSEVIEADRLVTAKPVIKHVGDGRGDQVVADPEQSIITVEQVVTRADTADLSNSSILEQPTTVPSDYQEQGLIDDDVEDEELGGIGEEVQPNHDYVNASHRNDLTARKHIDYKTIERNAY
jgi:hypothetical protein